MLTVIQIFFVRLISYSLIFKCRGSTAVVVLAMFKIFNSENIYTVTEHLYCIETVGWGGAVKISTKATLMLY